MIADVGKTAVNLTAPNGDIFAFFNSEIKNKVDISYYDKYSNNVKYKLVFSEVEKKKKYRALHYSRYYPNGVLESSQRIVPYTFDESETSDTTELVKPLYEVITPTLGTLPGRPGFNLMFWTNLSSKTNTLSKDSNGVYEYDYTKILLFENDLLEDVDLDDYSIKLLCSAQITWELLKTVGGGFSDTQHIYVPIVNKVYILLVQNGSIAIDFSGGGGSSSSLSIHNHSDNNNGGFSYAVFAPGTSLQPINWK